MKILVVDDEEVNRDLLNEYLIDEGFEVVFAVDGEDGYDKISNTDDISVVLLDRMMPKLDGMGFLKRIKLNPKFKDIPVIMQTAVAESESIVEGINSGAYYYLTKPYKKQILLSIVNAAINDAFYVNEVIDEVRNNKQTLGLLKKAYFEFRTIDEAQNLTYFIANSFPDPERVVLGLSEIMINAVEHGNLGITYDEKASFLIDGTLTDEIERRMKLPENVKKVVGVEFEKGSDEICVKISDEGDGFCWSDFLEIKPSRATDPNGRGIIMARKVSFDKLEYIGSGSEVRCIVNTECFSKNAKSA